MSMRISTNTMYESGISHLTTLQSQIVKTQNQLSANRRVLSGADDPIASARALEVTQSQAMNTQFATNRNSAKSSLSLVDQTLQSVTGQFQDIQSLIVQAGNGAFTQSDRESLATELEGRLNDLIGLANTTDGTGGYLFSGYKSNTQPFLQTPDGAVYQGDQGQRALQVGASRKMATTENGSTLFEGVPTGNGSFEVQAAGGNKGTGVMSEGSVVDRAKFLGHDYTVSFKTDSATKLTTYSVTDRSTTPATDVVPDTPYQAKTPIEFDGMSFDIEGTPVDGDSFSVESGARQSVFKTVTDLITTLRTPADGDAGKTALVNGLAAAGANMQNALDNVLTVQASVGARLKEVDYLDDSGSALDVQYTATLSGLQDLDMVKAISMFTQQQQTLQAAQMSFKTMSGLSLFNYIS
ncbi:flagellar hook-associated protein FlgL [Massilia aerilata]|uniref:Flagellar hook-associated protein FlgL n=1 Tax=Massilia aerilata TaxID=453817 RepID=A0ABW0RV92_9BURK